MFFFFKQKTAYEMRISDWSSDVALPISCLQDVAHDDFVDGLAIDAGAFDGGFDDDGAQLMRGQAGQAAHHAPHRSAGDGNKNDRVRHDVLLRVVLNTWRPYASGRPE